MNATIIKDLKAKVKKIKIESDDPEKAHGLEDDLRDDVLTIISSGKYTKKECIEFAKIALKTNKIEFARWCA